MSAKGSKFYQNCLEFVTEVPAEEVEVLEGVCDYFETSIKEILIKFVNDLTRKGRSCGSDDEHMLISKWFMRNFGR